MTESIYLKHPGPLPIAHRGGDDVAVENSLAAFEAAAADGYLYLETDVHVTADGVLIAFHDDDLDRVTDQRGAVAELPWSVVSRARLGGTERIPRLEDLLEHFPDHRFNIDAKSDDAVLPLVSVLRRTGALHRVCLAAFSNERLQRLRALVGPGVCTAASPREIGRLTLASRVPATPMPATLPYQCLQVPTHHKGVELLTPAFIAAAHRRGVQVHVWTINDPAEMNRLLDQGVDGIITDRPRLLRSVLEERGAWY